MDVTNKLLHGASPYLSSMVYCPLSKELTLALVDNPENMHIVLKVVFSGILQYREEILNNENTINSVIGINWLSDNAICICTEHKEVFIEFNGDPRRESVT